MAFDFSTVSSRISAIEAMRNAKPRGDALEDLVAEMLSEISGVTIGGRNVHTASGEAELDVVLVNEAHDNGLAGVQRDILVECKSQAGPLPAHAVGWFIRQHERRHLRYGILVALAGLTGRGKRARAAHHELVYAAERGVGIVVLTKEELMAIRSGEHLAAVIELKRQVLVSSYRARIWNAREIEDIDPASRRRRGLEGIEDAIRNMRVRAIDEVLDAAVRAGACGLNEGLTDARRALDQLAEQAADRGENPDEDPFWRREFGCIVAVGAAFVRLLDELPASEEARRVFHFEVEYVAPRGVRSLPGSELWGLLSEYYFRQASTQAELYRRRTVYTMVALIIEQMLLIEDIEPYDLYEDAEDYAD